MNTKKCPKCKKEKEVVYFSKDKYTKDGLQHKCKECSAKAARESYKKNKDKVKIKNKQWRDKAGKEYFEERHLLNTYGITREDRNKLLISQNHKCGVCGIDEVNAIKGKLFVDHDHATGKVRALLCHHCNTLIGHCKESEDILLNAIQYLRKYKE